ncbi:MAG TPA: CHAT domain-containing protein [Segeticoccus sp.]|uniref:CHAT domain-containing protein n=1 Tax=Segeticoccus sp. TaxID=2706531 RepID=UPI002D80CDBB|nr:CHAT domain-containing protein [Segeticoccus sp.]HET8599486.1 CHAT domain-containing protein [Segeticoccus sp.]
MLGAGELHRRGLESANAGRHRAARRDYLLALQRATDDETIARIELSLAYVESELGTAARGLELCHHALALPDIPDEVRGLVHGQLGMLQMRAGDGEAALVSLAEAERLLPATEHRALGNAHLARGNVHLQRRDVTAARHAFRAADEHYAAAGLVRQRMKARHNLGYTHLLAGDIPTALRLMQEAAPTFAELSPVYEAVGAQDRAEALLAAGMPEDAASALRTSARALASRGMRQRQAEALLVLARLLLTEDPAESRRVARRAMRLFAGRGSEVWALRAEAVAVAADVLAGRDTDRERAAALGRELRGHGLHRDAGQLALHVARAAVESGDLATAARLVRRTHPGPDAPLGNRLLRHEVRAELAAARQRPAHALEEVRAGLAELHEWQSSFGSLDLQSSLVGHGRRLALTGLGLALADGRPEVAFEWAERARALAVRVAPVRPPADPTTAAELVELRELFATLGSGADHGPGTTAARRRVAELQQSIRERAWQGEGSGRVTDPVSLEAVSEVLAATGGALVSHLVVEEHLYGVVVAGGTAKLVDLGSFAPVRQLLQGLQADLDMMATHLPGPLRRVVQATLQDRLAQLSGHLLAPLGDLGDGPVVLVPSGALAGTPWSMLPALTGRPLTVPRSASLWVRRHGDRRSPRSAGFVAGPRVARAEEEISHAARAWPDPPVLGVAEARAAAVSEVAGAVDVLHVAAHGRHSADNPLFSGLELTDGPWFGYDIDRLAAVPQTVVLSACELGRSTVRWGEEALGMTTAWLHAGSHAVIASPASVDDDVACAVLSRVHDRLAAGDHPAYALATATRGLADQLSSPFLCYGAGW